MSQASRCKCQVLEIKKGMDFKAKKPTEAGRKVIKVRILKLGQMLQCFGPGQFWNVCMADFGPAF